MQQHIQKGSEQLTRLQESEKCVLTVMKLEGLAGWTVLFVSKCFECKAAYLALFSESVSFWFEGNNEVHSLVFLEYLSAFLTIWH